MKQSVGRVYYLQFLPAFEKDSVRKVLNLKCKDEYSYLLHIYYLCNLLFRIS